LGRGKTPGRRRENDISHKKILRKSKEKKRMKKIKMPNYATILTLFSESSTDSRSLDACTLSLFLKSLADFRFPCTIPPTHLAAA